MSQKHVCPVCGFNELKEPVFGVNQEPSFEICPCCGFEFGFDDRDSYDDFRRSWIEAGAEWFVLELKPKNWDYNKQLKNLKG